MLLDLLAVLILLVPAELVLCICAYATWQERITGEHETFLYNLRNWNIIMLVVLTGIFVVIHAGELVAEPLGWALRRLS